MDGSTVTAFLVERLRISAILKVIDLIACAVFLWDYLLTIGMEIEYIWPGPWTYVKAIYILQRYLPFIDTLWIALQVDFGSGFSPERCKTFITIGRLVMLVGLTSSEMILTLRTWAVWNRNQVLTVALPILFLGCFLPHPIIFAQFIRTAEYANLPPPSEGCVQVVGDSIVVVGWILLLLWDALILMLMLVPAAKAFHLRGNSALYSTVYREGIIYYFYLFAISALNILLLQLDSIDIPYRLAATSMSRCLHSLLASRVLLHIRASADRGFYVEEYISTSL